MWPEFSSVNTVNLAKKKLLQFQRYRNFPRELLFLARPVHLMISAVHIPNSDKKAQLRQGLHATAVRVYYHLGFLKFESCTISSAVPENLTLEPNSTSIGKPVAKLWPFWYIQDDRQPPSWILSNRKYRHSIRLSRKS